MGNDVEWPWGMSDQDPDPESRPWVFKPRGFLLAVVEDAPTAERARVALLEEGFTETNLRIFTGEQLLNDRERFLAQRRPLQRVVGRITSDAAAVELFLAYARDGRSFLWVHVPDRHDADKAIRGLLGHNVLHFRYYGDDSVEDIHVG